MDNLQNIQFGPGFVKHGNRIDPVVSQSAQATKTVVETTSTQAAETTAQTTSQAVSQTVSQTAMQTVTQPSPTNTALQLNSGSSATGFGYYVSAVRDAVSYMAEIPANMADYVSKGLPSYCAPYVGHLFTGLSYVVAAAPTVLPLISETRASNKRSSDLNQLINLSVTATQQAQGQHPDAAIATLTPAKQAADGITDEHQKALDSNTLRSYLLHPVSWVKTAAAVVLPLLVGGPLGAALIGTGLTSRAVTLLCSKASEKRFMRNANVPNQPLNALLQQKQQLKADMKRNLPVPAGVGQGPLNQDVFMRGTFQNGQNFHNCQNGRKFTYKGNGIYQLEVRERQGQIKMRFASQDDQLRFMADSNIRKTDGSTTNLKAAPAQIRGEGCNKVTIPQAGRYLYTFKVDAAGNPEYFSVNKTG